MTGKELELHMVAELKGAGASAVNRMIVAINDREVMEMGQPIPPRTINVLDEGHFLRVPLESKISGLNIKRPVGVRYVDNV